MKPENNFKITNIAPTNQILKNKIKKKIIIIQMNLKLKKDKLKK